MILGEKVIYPRYSWRRFIQDQLVPREQVNWSQGFSAWGFSAWNGLYRTAGSDAAATAPSQATHRWGSAWEREHRPCCEP